MHASYIRVLFFRKYCNFITGGRGCQDDVPWLKVAKVELLCTQSSPIENVIKIDSTWFTSLLHSDSGVGNSTDMYCTLSTKQYVSYRYNTYSTGECNAWRPMRGACAIA